MVGVVCILTNFFINFFVLGNSYLTCERLAKRRLAKRFTILRLCQTFQSSVAYKDTKNKQENGGASRQTRFRPNLSISPPLSVSSLLFFCSLFYRECHCTKSALFHITVCCDLTRVCLCTVSDVRLSRLHADCILQ